MSDWLEQLKKPQKPVPLPKLGKPHRRAELAKTLKSLHSRGAAKLYGAKE